MYPIVLTAKSGNWRRLIARKADPAFRRFEERVLERDDHTCQFCGFQAREFQEVVNLDQNYQNNKFSNLVTACCFCMQCFFLESVGFGEYGGGTLVYLPELTQAQLNSFCHVIFCAITNDTGYKSTSQSIYRSFKFRSQVIEDKFGEGCSNPSTFGQLIVEMGVSGVETNQETLKDVRLLPSPAKFKKQIERWAATALDELSAEF